MRGWTTLREEGGGGRGPAPRLPPARRASPPSGPAAGPPVLAREGARRVGRGAAGSPRRLFGGGIRAYFWKQRQSGPLLPERRFPFFSHSHDSILPLLSEMMCQKF